MTNNEFLKKTLPYIASVVIFLIISLGYFSPDIFEGKVLFQDDILHGVASSHEAKEFYEKTGERTRWTNSLFSGMPNFQISPAYDSTSWMRKIERVYNLYLPSPAGLLFVMLLGFFILLKAMKVRTNLAILGAILYTFSSYFLIIIKAGHIWKFVTLAYIPPTIGGIILIYRKKYWLGAIVTTFFFALQLMSNHVQMSYYFGFVIVAFLIVFFIDAIKNKRLAAFFQSSGILLIAVLLAIGINISNFYHTYEYSKETMRGKTELKQEGNHNQTDNGLERDYIVQWSYGTGETWSLLIPDVKGGASGYLGNDKTAMEGAQAQYKQIMTQMNRYWGDQPGTAGPVYVGAFVMFLFIFGLFIVKSPVKWALLGVTILSVMLSWGQNFMPLTDFFIDYFPLYNKFRAVSSILVIAEFCIPLLAILALKEIIDYQRSVNRLTAGSHSLTTKDSKKNSKNHPDFIKKYQVAFGISLLLTAGFCVLFAIIPDKFFDFLSIYEKEQFLPQASADPRFDAFLKNLEEVRIGILTADAWRSLFVILLGATALYLFAKNKISSIVLVIALMVLCFFDLASVGKRYLNSNDFITKKERTNPFPETFADKQIEQDKTLYFRVFNQTVNTFNDATTSYRHKSVGGYHAAKLSRYQDLISNQLVKGNMEVFNMLNTKYFIVPDEENKQPVAMLNPNAYGNAWFVDEIKWVNNATEEMNALTGFQATKTAIIDKQFEKELKQTVIAPKDTLSSIVLTEYAPNKLVFKSNAKKDELAVFSDIYYPGWKAAIDGKETPIVRADYVLRSVEVPAGEHEIVFSFDPKSVYITETIAYISFAIFLLACVFYVVKKTFRSRFNSYNNKRRITNPA